METTSPKNTLATTEAIPDAVDLVRIDLAVEGMTCSACSNQIQRQLSKLDGITDARVNFANGRATVIHDGTIETDLLRTTIESLGYAVPETPDHDAAEDRREAAEPYELDQASEANAPFTGEARKLHLVSVGQVLPEPNQPGDICRLLSTDVRFRTQALG